VRGVEQASQDRAALTGHLQLRVDEDLRAVQAGRPTLFARTYSDCALRVTLRTEPRSEAPRAETLEAGSPLAGCAVRFTWAPARGDWGRLYEAREASEEFLPRLAADLELAGFLPPRAVAVGDAWEVEPARAGDVFVLGGEVPLRFSKGGDHSLARTVALGVGGPLHEVFAAPVQGSVRARLAALEDGPEGQRARVALELDVRVTRDVAQLTEQRLNPVELEDGVQVRSATLTWTFRGQGELVWSVAQGRAVSVALSGAEDVASRAELQQSDGAVVNEVRLSGGLKLRIDVAPAGAPAAPR
jgi:hypothetical protein